MPTFRELVNGSLTCGELPLFAWALPGSTLIATKRTHVAAKPGDKGCGKANFTIWRTKDQITLYRVSKRFDFMATCLDCGAVTQVHADIWKEMTS